MLPAQAVEPTNHFCAGAEVIQFNAADTSALTAVTDISQASTVGDAPGPSCAFGNTVSHSIWYLFTPKVTAYYTISTCADAPTATTVADTIMALYTASAGCGTATNEIACDDDSCGPDFMQAAITAQLLADATYYIVVWEYGTDTPNPANASLQLRVTKTAPPTNDTVGNATPVFLNLPMVGSTILAQDDYELPDTAPCFSGIGQSSSTAQGRDVVYTFTAPVATNYSIKVSNYNNQDPYDLVVYAATSLPNGPSPALVTTCLAAANRSPVSEFEEIMCLPLAASQTIFIVVDEDMFSPEGSSFLLEVTTCIREEEPNNSTASATPYAFGMEGSITPATDQDFFSLGTFPTNSRAFVLVDGSAAHITDFDLRIMTDAGTLIQYDDADNDDPFGMASPNIAGAILTGDPIFLKVTTKAGTGQAEPYRVFAVVQPPLSRATPETEPNNTVTNFNESPNNYFYGTLAGPSPSTDMDVYRFVAEAGTLVFLGLDSNPQRGPKSINAQLELLDGDGNLLLKVDDAGTTVTTPSGLASESLVFRVANDGYYFARVSISPSATSVNGTGDYLLSISKNGFIRDGDNSLPAWANIAWSGPIYAGTPMTLSGSIIDYDINQPHQVIIDWGDGSSATTTNLPPGAAALSVSHTFSQPASNLSIHLTVSDPFNIPVNTNLTVTVPAPPAQPQLSSVSFLPNGHALLQLHGSPGITYRVQTSMDMHAWSDLASSTADSNGDFQVEDPTSPLKPQLWYRAIWP